MGRTTPIFKVSLHSDFDYTLLKFCDCIKTNAGQWHTVEGPVAPSLLPNRLLVAPLPIFKLSLYFNLKTPEKFRDILHGCDTIVLTKSAQKQSNTWHSTGNSFCGGSHDIRFLQDRILPWWHTRICAVAQLPVLIFERVRTAIRTISGNSALLTAR